MQSFTKSIFDLFNQKRRYLVPLFQRPYVWGQEKQWEPLWEDIQAKAEAHINGRDMDPHFLGAIVLNQVKTFDDQILTHDVIDGQQRLTTFQLFLAAFRDFAQAHGDQMRAEELRVCTRNDGLVGSEEERFKVWPTNADQEQFQHVLSAGSREELERLYPPVLKRKKLQPRPRMVEAYLFFYGALESFLAERSEDKLTVIKSLYQAMQKSLQLVSIELEGKDDPQVIFETLNARGEALLPSDLLRNFIFLRANRTGHSARDLYDTYWMEFDTKGAEDGNTNQGFWKKEERQGRLTRPRLDLFIQHFLALKTKHEVNAGKLYQSYRTWIQEEKPYANIEDELKDLVRHARVFERFFVPDATNRMGVFAARLRALDTSTVYPLLLYLLADSGASQEELTGIAMDLESFIVRRMVCGMTIKNYNSLFLQLLRALLEQETVTRSGFQALLLAQTGPAGVWPTDAEFKRAWLNEPVYKSMKSSARIAMMLRALEDAHVNAKREEIIIKGDLTVEHVMPQSWATNWPLPAGPTDPEEAAAERDRLLHTLGNLTLLTQELNSSVSNAAYAVRRPEITKQSALQLNAYFQDVETWDEAAILKRGEHLFEMAVKLWPYPATSEAKLVPQAMAEPSASAH